MPQKVIPHLSFTLQDNVIDYVDSFNFLGITFDCHLTWKSHTCNLSIKLSSISGMLHSLRSMFPVVILQGFTCHWLSSIGICLNYLLGVPNVIYWLRNKRGA